MKKAWDKYHNKGGKQKATEYYRRNADLIKFEEKNKYKNFPEKEKNKKEKYQKERYYYDGDLSERFKQIKEIIMLQKNSLFS